MQKIYRVLLVALALSPGGCGGDDSEAEVPLHSSARPSIPAAFELGATFSPDVSSASLSSTIDHPLFPAPPGAAWTYLARTDEGEERTVVQVEPETRQVWGTSARVVHDTVYLDGDLIEDTRDWYAKDADGNVWYLGEDTVAYDQGQPDCPCGAWEAGVDGGLPGVVMLADPQPGDVYRQEYLRGQAEDIGEIVSLSENVSVPAGSWSNCLKTRDRSAIEAVIEYKYYCPGIGVVLEEEEGDRVELVEYSGL